MKSLMSLALVAICTILKISAAGPPKESGERNFTLYTIDFRAQAEITRFESTVILPPTSKSDGSSSVDTVSFWPGLAPDPLKSDYAGILQNVISNEGLPPGASQWSMRPFLFGNNSYWRDLVGSNMLVYPMQAVTSVFTLNVPKNRVMDSWIVESGVLNGPNSFVGSFTVSPLTDPPKPDTPYKRAFLMLQLQNRGKWDFGPLTWQNIIIVARTNETDWCKAETDLLNLKLDGGPSVTRNAKHGEVTCYIAGIELQGLK